MCCFERGLDMDGSGTRPGSQRMPSPAAGRHRKQAHVVLPVCRVDDAVWRRRIFATSRLEVRVEIPDAAQTAVVHRRKGFRGQVHLLSPVLLEVKGRGKDNLWEAAVLGGRIRGDMLLHQRIV